MGLCFFVQKCFYLSHGALWSNLLPYKQNHKLFGSTSWCIALGLPLFFVLLLKSHMWNVLRHCEILTGTSYLFFPKARSICCAAGGDAAFQNLSTKIFARLLGNKGWMLRDCSSQTAFHPISELSNSLDNKQCTAPTSPHSRLWWSPGMRSSSPSWNGQRSGSQRPIFVLYLLLSRHK